jgi:two-component system phosphate regulon response regulator PhoB
MTAILVVEDEPDLRDLVLHHIEAAGWTGHGCGTGREALDLCRTHRLDLVVLDLMLPDMAGVDVCRRLRAETATATVPVIMLTARAAESDRVAGFEAGADDYVCKPFSTRELMLRVRAVLRRGVRGSETAQGTANADAIEVDVERHRVLVGGSEVRLTALEFRLLATLLDKRGKVLSRPQLLALVWGVSPHLHTRTVDTHVKRLRERLGAAGDCIEAVRGVGYRIALPDGAP